MENISKKEWWIGLAVMLLALAIAFLFEPFAKTYLLQEIRIYQLALPITDSTQFTYAEQTQVGNVIAYGQMIGNEPVSFPELTGRYSMVAKIKQRYTMHSYVTCTTINKSTVCTTHYYWSWDYVGEQDLTTATFSYMGLNFKATDLDLSIVNELPLNSDTMQPDSLKKSDGLYIYDSSIGWANAGDIRYHYEILPLQFSATMFIRFFNGQQTNPIHPNEKIQVFYEQTISQVLNQEKQKMLVFDIVWFVFWIILLVGGYLYYAYEYLDVE